MTAVDLEIGGHHVRVACTGRIARRVRRALADHMVDQPAPVGFLLRPTTPRQRRHVLVDRCGFVLGSTPHADEAVTMLCDHLTALLPLPEGRARFRLRALTTGDRAIVCTFPLLYVPPFDESELSGTGHELIDRLAIDVDAVTGEIVLDAPRWLPTARSAVHHRRPSDQPLAVDRLVVAGGPAASTGRSELVARICADSLDCTREVALDAAIALVTNAGSLRAADLWGIAGGLRGALDEKGGTEPAGDQIWPGKQA